LVNHSPEAKVNTEKLSECLSENGYFSQILRQTKILIFEILNVWMPVPMTIGVVNPATAGRLS
jgi:hypothetical protein